MKPIVSIITRCKGRLEHLKKSLPFMILQDNNDTEVIVVNYNSPDGLSAWMSHTYPNHLSSGKLVEIVVPNTHYFDHSHSRNVGLRSACGEWVFFVDADCMIAPPLVSHVLSKIDNLPNTFATIGTPAYGAIGSLFARRQDLIDIGGYMEDLFGWGYEHVDIKNRLFMNDKEMFSFNPKLMASINHNSLEVCMYFAPPHNDIYANNNWQMDMYNKNSIISKKYIEENGFIANKNKEWGSGGIRHISDIKPMVDKSKPSKPMFLVSYDSDGNILNLDELRRNGCPQEYIDKANSVAKGNSGDYETIVFEHDKSKLSRIQEKTVLINEDKSNVIEIPD